MSVVPTTCGLSWIARPSEPPNLPPFSSLSLPCICSRRTLVLHHFLSCLCLSFCDNVSHQSTAAPPHVALEDLFHVSQNIIVPCAAARSALRSRSIGPVQNWDLLCLVGRVRVSYSSPRSRALLRSRLVSPHWVRSAAKLSFSTHLKPSYSELCCSSAAVFARSAPRFCSIHSHHPPYNRCPVHLADELHSSLQALGALVSLHHQ